jgi:hypothetical protein
MAEGWPHFLSVLLVSIKVVVAQLRLFHSPVTPPGPMLSRHLGYSRYLFVGRPEVSSTDSPPGVKVQILVRIIIVP